MGEGRCTNEDWSGGHSVPEADFEQAVIAGAGGQLSSAATLSPGPSHSGVRDIESDRLTRKLLDGLRWNTAGFAVRGAAQLLVGIVLARLLGPAPFGLMAMAWAAYQPAFILAEAGLGYALVQSETIDAHEVRFSFWMQSSCGVVLAFLFCLTAPQIAGFFDTPALATILVALSPAIVFQTVGLTAVNLLRRSVDFRRLQITQLAAFLVSQLLVALPFAYFGAGVWSLVVAAIASSVVISASAYAIVRHEVGLNFSRKAFRLTRVSRWFLLLNVVNAMQGALTPIAMGRLLGADTVGLFDRSYALFVTPVDRAAEAASGVLFSFFSRTNGDRERQREIFLGCLCIAALLGIPSGAFMMSHADLMVAVTLGANWAPAAPLLLPLSLCLPISLFLEATVPILNGRGRPEIEVVTVIGMIAIFLAAVPVAHGGAREIVWILVATYGFRVGCLLLSVNSLLDIGLRIMLQAILPGLIAAAMLLFGNLFLAAALPAGLPGALRLLILVILSAAGLAAYCTLYYLWLPKSPLRRAFR